MLKKQNNYSKDQLMTQLMGIRRLLSQRIADISESHKNLYTIEEVKDLFNFFEKEDVQSREGHENSDV